MALGKSAAAQALGYLYQFERAIFWLSKSEIDFVSIETDDDVVSKLKSGQEISVIYEQDKSSISKTNPFANANINLWKTLAIWLSIQKKYPDENARFVLATNKRVPTSSTVYKIHKANFVSNYNPSNPVIESCYIELIQSGKKLKGTAKEIFDEISSDFSEEEFKSLLSKIILSADEYWPDRSKFKDEVRENLRVGSQVPFYSVYDKIFGWLVNTVIDKWASGEEATLRSDLLIDIKDIYIREVMDRPFIEQAVSLIPVFEYERESQQHKLFIKQMELIESEDDDIIDAIDHFLRATKERDRWAENGMIPCKLDIDQLEDSIKQNWRRHSKKHILESKSKPALTKADIGNLIYIDASETSGYSLAGYPVTQPYTILGSLHILSNNLDIGWHPDWKIELKK